MLYHLLPTARQKIRKIRKDSDRRLLAMSREYKQVLKQIYNLGYEDLAVPYQRGWKRSFVLRDDVKQSARAAFFDSILQKINTVQHSERKDFKRKRRRRRKYGYMERPQELNKPGLYEFLRMKFTDEEAAWFETEEYFDVFSKSRKTRYTFREPWRFVLKTEPNMITQVRKHDWELECRKEELSDIIDRNPVRARLDWLQGNGYKWYKAWGYREDERLPKNPFKNKQKQNVVWVLFNEEQMPENISFELFS